MPDPSDAFTSSVICLVSSLVDSANTHAFTAAVDELERLCRQQGTRLDTVAIQEVGIRQMEIASQRGRREDKLQRVLRTTQSLLVARRTDDLLEVLVRSARELSGADISFLNLCDDAGQMILRATDGAVSSEFKSLQLTPGTGINGRVFTTGSPHLSEDFSRDTAIRHDPNVDTTVMNEGIVSLVAIPIFNGNRVVAVLSAAWRTYGVASIEHIATLAPLADLAAIALLNAELEDHRRAATDHLEQDYTILQNELEAAERSAIANDRLASLLVDGADPELMGQTIASLFGGEVLIIDSGGIVRAGSAGMPGHHAAAALLTAARNCVDAAPVLVSVAQQDAWSAPLLVGDEFLGAIAVLGADLDPIEVRTLSRAAVLTTLLILNERAIDDARAQTKADIVEELLGDPGRPVRAALRARHVGYDTEKKSIVLAIAPSSAPNRLALRSAARKYATDHDGLFGELGGMFAVIIPGHDPEASAQDIHTILNRIEPTTVGATGPVSTADKYNAAFNDSSRCVHALNRLGRVGTAATLPSLGFIGTLLGADPQSTLPQFISATIGPLINYDNDRGTHLLLTLRTYLARGRSLSEAASDLSVHPNTVSQRLARITTILGDWQEHTRLLEIQLALQVLAVST